MRFQANLVYKASSKPAKATSEILLFKKKKKKRTKRSGASENLRELDALTEVLGSIPSTHLVAYN